MSIGVGVIGDEGDADLALAGAEVCVREIQASDRSDQVVVWRPGVDDARLEETVEDFGRSEERRVGKECRL